MSIDVKNSFITIINSFEENKEFPTIEELKYFKKLSNVNEKEIIDEFKSLCEPTNVKECCKYISYYDDIIDNISDEEKHKIYSDNYKIIKAVYILLSYLIGIYENFEGKSFDPNFMPDFNFDS
jgi:hypothetical protein